MTLLLKRNFSQPNKIYTRVRIDNNFVLAVEEESFSVFACYKNCEEKFKFSTSESVKLAGVVEMNSMMNYIDILFSTEENG